MEPEVVESYDILIEFDYPLPPRSLGLQLRASKWSTRVAPMRKFPGREARIGRGLPARKARDMKGSMVAALYKHNPREKWTVRVLGEDDKTWGVWATYEGLMTETEFLKSEMMKEERKDERQRKTLLKQARHAQKLGRTAYNPSLRPPTIDP